MISAPRSVVRISRQPDRSLCTYVESLPSCLCNLRAISSAVVTIRQSSTALTVLRRNGKKIRHSTIRLRRSSKSWIIALACVIVVVVGIFGFQYLKSEDKKEATATTENKTSAKTTENNAGEDVADAKDSTEKSQVLSYTDNKDMDLSACTDSDDYQYVSSEDNSFEFAYPKYLFNRSYVNKTGNQYTLEYANSDKADDYEIKAVISSQKAGSGNAVKSVQKLYKQKKKSIKNVTYAYPQGGKTPKLYQGKSSMIVMGYLDSDKTKCEYVLLTSDGKKDYMMQINFFDSDYKDEYKEINYVVDCMYRGCSFTNSTYQMRTFDQFREDDMGVKK